MIINQEDATFGKMQNIKRRFFALRNGEIASMYRKAGSPYRIIFGLQLPQIVEVAMATGVDMELANELWDNNSTRESRLMAPMIVDVEKYTDAQARRWVSMVCCVEEADVLCHRLLRKLPYAPDLVKEFIGGGNTDMVRYTGLRLARNLIYNNVEIARMAANAEKLRECKLTLRLAEETLEEVEFMG